MVKVLLAIGTGSFLGGISRFLLSRFVQNQVISSFPYGTFVVNIIGCFIIGILYGLFEKDQLLSPEWRMFLTVGFCGGFTTFSTFAGENYSLLKDGNILYAAMYAATSVFLGIMAVWLGNLLIKLI
ncbi:MAG: fluoride efflux transporter CrcB [Sphingobacteriales bacterium]|jgi:CrcB protein|nr:fluoride efflux transporter CrcB [Sphingobacteriales bacterium]